MSKSYQKLSKNVIGGNGKARNTVTLHLSQKLSAKWQRPIHTHTSTLHPTHTHTSDAFIPFPPPLPRIFWIPTQAKSLLTQLDIGEYDFVGFWDRRWNIAAYKPHEIEVRCIKHVFVV